MREVHTLSNLSTKKIQGSFVRYVCVTLLFLLISVTGFGFTMFINLKPANAFIVPVTDPGNTAVNAGNLAATIEQSAWSKIWEFTKSMIRVFVVQMVARMSIKYIRELENIHVIRNVMYYKDSLVFEQYIGDKINKYVKQRNPDAKTADYNTEPTNLFAIMDQANLGIMGSYGGGQMKSLALLEKGGLTPKNESDWIAGVLSSLTSQVACGGTKDKILKNLSTYMATKATGFDFAKIDTANASNYYLQMTHLGNPLTMPEYYEIGMKEKAREIENEAKHTADIELTAGGQKSERDSSTNKTVRAGQTIGSWIGQLLDSAFTSTSAGSDAGIAAKILGKFLADLVAATIFNSNSRVFMENPYCRGSAGYGSAAMPSWDGGDPDPIIENPTKGAYILANGQNSVSVVKDSPAVNLTWNAGSDSGQVFINNSSVSRSGSQSVSTSEIGVQTYKMTASVSNFDSEITLGVAVVNVTAPEDPGAGGGVGPENPSASIDSFTGVLTGEVDATGKQAVNLSWTVSTTGSTSDCRLYLSEDGATYVNQGRGSCSNGWRLKYIDATTTFYLRAADQTSGEIYDRKNVTVSVSDLSGSTP